jgi:hypothetical protein
MNDGSAKQQIVDKIKNSSAILVTVSTNPSVDELSAALGLTLLLNKMEKHATAVFSGTIPPAITFLDAEKTFENSVDSLRDFIIALDKEKADHLRYKVEGEVVKIFITPYRTTITSDDLDFSQGDYNVELVLALGVKNKDHLDAALAAHGRILHDATVASISVGSDKSELGSINWLDANASSLSELLVSLGDSLKSDKPLLDEQIATAFLTGIVAATDRFSNNRTSSRVMTMAAQLMAAGANQQLIASKLQEAHAIGEEATPEVSVTNEHADGTTDLSEGKSTKLKKDQAAPVEEPTPKKDDGSLDINHDETEEVTDQAANVAATEQPVEVPIDAVEEELAKQTKRVAELDQAEAADQAEQALADQLATVAPAAAATTVPNVADLQKDIAAANAEVTAAAEGDLTEPSLGGVLNATTEQAAEDSRRALESDRNHTILSHNTGDYVGDQTPSFQAPLNAAAVADDTQPSVDIFKDTAETPAPTSRAADIQPPAPAEPVETPAPTPTLAEIDEQNRAPHEEARAAVEAAFGAVPYTPPAKEEPQPAPAVPEVTPPLPPLPPLPDFSTLPPLPPLPPLPSAPTDDAAASDDTSSSTPAPQPPTPPAPSDPGQFRIPGQ